MAIGGAAVAATLSASPPPSTSSLTSYDIHHRSSSSPSSSSSSLCFPSSRNKKNSRNKLACRMAGIDRKGMTSDVCSGTMIYEPILEEGVFRFDCSSDDRNAAFPSLSFANPKVRETPLMSENLPFYIPTFECTLGQQIVHLQFPAGTSFYGTGEVSGQLERTGKRVFTWNTDAW